MRTIEDNFDYQVKNMLKTILENIDMEKSEEEEQKDINDILWENKSEVGRVFLETVWDYFGEEIVNESFEKFKKDKEESEE
jgi:hypothetical protein